jgi:uncharacterized protein
MSPEVIVFFLMTALVAYIIGLAKGGLGGALGVLATPLMALVIPTSQAVGLLLPILMFADVFAVAAHWRRWNARLVWLLTPGAIVGVTIATYVITNAPTEFFQIALGVIVLLFVVYKLFEKRIFQSMHYQSRRWHGVLAGTLAGFSSALAHTGGPPVQIYLLVQDITPRIFIATSALFFLILNWVKVPYYYYAGLFNWEQIRLIIWILPMVPLGVWSGKWIALRLPKQTFDNVIIVLLLVAGLLLIFN